MIRSTLWLPINRVAESIAFNFSYCTHTDLKEGNHDAEKFALIGQSVGCGGCNSSGHGLQNPNISTLAAIRCQIINVFERFHYDTSGTLALIP